jgi:hypothetical protein
MLSLFLWTLKGTEYLWCYCTIHEHTKQRNDWCNWYVLLQNGTARITEITTMNLWSSVMRHFVSRKWSICRCFKEKDCLHFQGWSEPIRNRPVRKYLPTSCAAPSVRSVLHKFRQEVSLMPLLRALMCLRLAGEAWTLGGGFWRGGCPGDEDRRRLGSSGGVWPWLFHCNRVYLFTVHCLRQGWPT